MHANKWIEMAPGYTYTFVGSTEAEAFLAAHFADRPEIASTYHALKNPALKSDVLRYLLLYIHGGIYSDADTKPLVRLDAWVPAQKRREVRLLLALEYDEAEEPNPSDFVYPVQFCQWTIAAAPNHTVFARMVDRMLAGLQDVADHQSTTLGKAYLSDFDVVNTTGPVAWTEVVFQLLQEVDGRVKGYGDLMRMGGPRYYGDVSVLPLETFRADYLDDWGVSWRKGRNALVRHFFKGAWKTPPGVR